MENFGDVGYILNSFLMIFAGILVMWMAAGFAMLEAGLTRSKNNAVILLKNVAIFAIASIMYYFIGYNLMYGTGNDFIGSGMMLDGITYGDHSLMADFFFQVVFVATAASVISGSVAERMKLWPFLLFVVVLTAFIYPMQGHWTWGGTGLGDAAEKVASLLQSMDPSTMISSLGDDAYALTTVATSETTVALSSLPADTDIATAYGLIHGFSDFAGSTIVHSVGGWAALAGVLLLGARKGKYGKDGKVRPIPGSNLPLATLGTFILWMGWFGFNGGSQLAMGSKDDVDAIGMVVAATNMAAAAGAIMAAIITQLLYKKVDLTMVLNGALGGLVAVTAAPDTGMMYAFEVGIVAAFLVVFAVRFFDSVRIDDPVGALSVHLVNGIWGTLAVGILGNGEFGAQLMGVVVIGVFTFTVSFAVWYLIKVTVGLRISEEEEYDGIDIHETGIEAYPEFAKNLK